MSYEKNATRRTWLSSLPLDMLPRCMAMWLPATRYAPRPEHLDPDSDPDPDPDPDSDPDSDPDLGPTTAPDSCLEPSLDLGSDSLRGCSPALTLFPWQVVGFDCPNTVEKFEQLQLGDVSLSRGQCRG